MADQGGSDDAPVTFHVKSSNDKKHTVTVPLSLTVLQLKEKLADASYAGLAPDRQRLIYSGRVLKDPDTLGSYKIKEGNTVHLVKGAESNSRQNPANQGSTAAAGGNSSSSGPVPTNLSSGPGANNPLAGLTGARYAGLAHLPNQSLFGPDGGMGPPPDPEQIIHMLENPQFASTINEALSNPQIIDTMIQQNPMLRDMGPEVRQMLQSPEFRRMMTDPAMLRQTMQIQRAMGGGMFGRGGPGGQAFPAPGATDTTPPGAQASDSSPAAGQTPRPGGQQWPYGMMGGGGGGGGGQANPFASLFNPAAFGAAGNNNNNGSTEGGNNNNNNQQGNQAPFNPFLNNPFAQNPQMLAQFMQAMQGQPQGQPHPGEPGQQQQQQQQGQGQTDAPPNPYASLLSSLASARGGAGGAASGDGTAAGTDNAGAGATGGMPAFDPAALEALLGANPFAGMLGGNGGGWGAGGAGGAAPPADTRPPEERYADQLRQLNDMGFYDFDRNVEALRRSGGSVQGAVEHLLTQPPS